MSHIAALPRRDPEFDEREINPLTAWLRTPVGTMRLRAIQARACLETLRSPGLFMAARVGAGKTLTVGLLAAILRGKRPLLVTEASVVRDTRELLDQYRKHWRIPKITIVSYHKISNRTPEQKRAEAEGKVADGFLETFNPDVVFLDEVHRLKRVRSAACARRFARWFHGHPEVPVSAFSGTPVRDSFLDWVHIVVWCLKHGAPVPLEPDVQRDWAALLDDEKPTRDGWTKLPEYAILQPHLGAAVHDRESARKALQERLLWTPGVIVSRDSFEDVPLTIEPIRVEPPASLDDTWRTLRELWEAPDGWLLPDKQLGVYGVANKLALGFYYTCDPRPPRDWLDARRDWCKFCRQVLEDSEDIDTETQVRDACRAGRLPSWAWDAWAAIKDEYDPDEHKVPVWFSRHALDVIVDWGKRGGIVWIEWRALGAALVEITGWPWFSTDSRDQRGRFLGDVTSTTDPTIIVSRRVAEVGKNLQGTRDRPGWDRNLFCTPPRTSKDAEQWFGRTHRDGQWRPVTVQYLVGCLENLVAIPIAKRLAEMSLGTFTQPQKLLRWDAVEPPMAWAKGPAFGELG